MNSNTSSFLLVLLLIVLSSTIQVHCNVLRHFQGALERADDDALFDNAAAPTEGNDDRYGDGVADILQGILAGWVKAPVEEAERVQAERINFLNTLNVLNGILTGQTTTTTLKPEVKPLYPAAN